MRRRWEMELKVGIFVTVGTLLIMLAILVLGSTENFLAKQSHYNVHFANVDGLLNGAKVVVAGINVGTVDDIELDKSAHDILVTISIARKYAELLREDSAAEIATQGVLGDKFISLSVGSLTQPEIKDGATVATRPSKDLTQFLSKGDQLLVSLTSIAGGIDRIVKSLDTGNRSETLFAGMAATAKNLSQATDKLNRQLDDNALKNVLRNLNGILEKVNNGSGTLGALVNDPGLYDDAKALMGGANHNRIVRNLVRQTIKDNHEKK